VSGALDGRVVIVTGSGRGLGRAYAEALAAAGASVVVNDVDAGTASDTVNAIRAAGGTAVAVIAPVGPAETADLLVDKARAEFGRLDVMITNAGVLRDRVLWKTTDDDFGAVVSTHLQGTFTCGRAAAVAMRAQGDGGRIIVIGSPAGQHGNFGQTTYSAVKAGIVAMARVWSMELGRAGIMVNAVIPTAMTEMAGTMPIYKEMYRDFLKGVPLPSGVRREHAMGAPQDVSPLLVWLSSLASDGVTGQAIGIGGDRLTLYAHPAEAAVEYADGGWTADGIAAAWTDKLSAHAQRSGVELPPLD
jgi:NAD(P)-dependent dehydrogenase (short-subunit alcohol dehydrogenase family)